jgi:Zinc-binding loop region of homing endonuclease
MSQAKQKWELLPNAGSRKRSSAADYAAHRRVIRASLQKMNKTKLPKTKCLLLETKTTTKDGYPKIRYSIRKTYQSWEDGTVCVWRKQGTDITRRKLVDFKTTAHSFVYWAAHGNFRGQGLEISHLCSNRKCIARTHLSLESHEYNLSRIGCFKKNNSCPHTPPCIGGK